MKVQNIEIARLKIPLIRPFITALRQTSYIEDIVVILKTDNGLVAYGSAAVTPVITGDTEEAIIGGIRFLAHKIIGADLVNYEEILSTISTALVNNNSAKAALDMAIYDLVAKWLEVPLYQLLGGGTAAVATLTTISVKEYEAMALDAQLLVKQGFKTLKIKVGLNGDDDLRRIMAIRKAVGDNIDLVIDANQGWDAKSALRLINGLNNSAIEVKLVEQPVKAWDLANLKFVRDNSVFPVYADEAVFGVRDAAQIIENQAADGLNIKLMKTGGIYAARTIYELAASHAVPCLAGCMLESPIGVNAMASLVASRKNFKFIDLDPVSLIKSNPVHGGITSSGATLNLSPAPGLGIKKVDGLESLALIK